MREIVVGQLTKSQGIQQINVWFRFGVPVARQPYYAKIQASAQPGAPGDYSSTDQAEIAQIQTGLFVERANFLDVIDPTSTLATIQARLINIYNAALAQFVADDNSTLARWDSSWDGTTWTMKSS